MKTKIAALVLLLFAFAIAAQQNPTKFAHFVKTVASTSTPESITSTNVFCDAVTLLGIKAARTANVGVVYVGWTSNDDTQFFPISISGEVLIEAGQGRHINLKDIYIDVLNNGDGVGVYYK